MLKIDNLTFTYPHRTQPVLRNLSLEVDRGGIYGLLGLNGVGKTTLLNLIGGLLTPTSGTVTFGGSPTRSRIPATLADIFYVGEEVALPSVTIREYVRSMSGFYPRFSAEEMASHLSAFGLSDTDRLHRLSMGQRKKAFLSFAIACNTGLLLLDEPTNGLDIPGKKVLRGILGASADGERTVIMSTHQIADIHDLLDNIILMHDGEIILNASISEIASLLKFEVTTSADIIRTALYSQPVFSGNIVIVPNTDGIDSDIDLETFFYFCISDPDTVKTLFT